MQKGISAELQRARLSLGLGIVILYTYKDDLMRMAARRCPRLSRMLVGPDDG
jgi:hypothetical protein